MEQANASARSRVDRELWGEPTSGRAARTFRATSAVLRTRRIARLSRLDRKVLFSALCGDWFRVPQKYLRTPSNAMPSAGSNAALSAERAEVWGCRTRASDAATDTPVVLGSRGERDEVLVELPCRQSGLRTASAFTTDRDVSRSCSEAFRRATSQTRKSSKTNSACAQPAEVAAAEAGDRRREPPGAQPTFFARRPSSTLPNPACGKLEARFHRRASTSIYCGREAIQSPSSKGIWLRLAADRHGDRV